MSPQVFANRARLPLPSPGATRFPKNPSNFFLYVAAETAPFPRRAVRGRMAWRFHCIPAGPVSWPVGNWYLGLTGSLFWSVSRPPAWRYATRADEVEPVIALEPPEPSGETHAACCASVTARPRVRSGTELDCS